MINGAPVWWVDPVPFPLAPVPFPALDQSAETLPGAQGVAELFNFIAVLL